MKLLIYLFQFHNLLLHRLTCLQRLITTEFHEKVKFPTAAGSTKKKSAEIRAQTQNMGLNCFPILRLSH